MTLCEVDQNSEAQTVTIGAGLIWDDVYAALDSYGVNVVGGRELGVGVARSTLGGGMFERYVRWKDMFNDIHRLLVVHKSIWFNDRHRASV